MLTVGIALAFVAMLSWGFGDFLMQKSTRRFGDWETLFVVTGFGAIVLLPFVWRDLPALFSSESSGLWILVATSVVLFLAALLDLEALREGKLSIVEPIWSLEIVSASILSFFILQERISLLQAAIIFVLIVFLMMVAFKESRLSRKHLLEKGVLIAVAAALLMGGANFFMGWGARLTDPLMVNFFTDIFMAILSALYLIGRGKLGKTFRDMRQGYGLLLPLSIADKAAWLAYAFSMSLAPIAIATALSESYIIVTVLLGLTVNRERLHAHQKVGLVGAVIAAIALASVTTA